MGFLVVMAEDLALKISSLKIMAEEDQAITFDKIPETDTIHDMALTLVGKVLTVRTYNFEALKRTLNLIWAISKATLFRSIECDMFVNQFATKHDKDKVLAGRPCLSTNIWLCCKRLKRMCNHQTS